MTGKKQVMDMHSETNGVSQMESDEQQRNWTDKKWFQKTNDSLANYDKTRSSLNFEVTKDGKVQPIDTSQSIAQKMAENLAARGIKDPNANPNIRRKRRTIAKFIFGGNRERMHELAFGNQTVDLSMGADNSHITRCKDIEDWAKDVYNFVAKRFGEENIIGFYVHLDEKNPHCHCTVVPVDKAKKRISWKSVFGDGREAESANMTKLHNELVSEVSEKWGLERGDSKEETKAKHRSTEEYKQNLIHQVCELESTREGLIKQLHRAEIKLKGLTTMIANLQARKEKVEEEIELIAKQFEQGNADNAELSKRLSSLRKQLEDIDVKLEERNKMLDETNETLSQAKERLNELRKEHSRAQEYIGDDAAKEAAEVQKNILSTYNKMVVSSIEPLLPTLSSEQRKIIEESGYTDLTENGQHVINCALLLALKYVHEATNYAESCGGGGSPGTGWGRDKDDDDERWWIKCIAQSAAMVSPKSRKQKHSR